MNTLTAPQHNQALIRLAQNIRHGAAAMESLFAGFLPTTKEAELELDDIFAKLDAQRRYQAACRAVGIVNKLTPGPFRARHASRVFSNLNKIRGML